jgi:hypothetical protein
MADARDGQTGLRPIKSAAQFDDSRVDHVAQFAVHVVGEDGHPGADLVGGKPRPAWFGHRVQQIGYQPGQGVVEADDRIASGGST